MRLSLAERFARHTAPGPGGCVLWTGSIDRDGYGRFKCHSGLAHRFAWETAYGAIPPGLTIDHLCRVRHCVNPAHMELVTLQGGAAGGAWERAKTHCPAGHAYAGDNVRVYRGMRFCRACHREREHRRRHPSKQ